MLYKMAGLLEYLGFYKNESNEIRNFDSEMSPDVSSSNSQILHVFPISSQKDGIAKNVKPNFFFIFRASISSTLGNQFDE